jgi:hypothetical protein
MLSGSVRNLGCYSSSGTGSNVIVSASDAAGSSMMRSVRYREFGDLSGNGAGIFHRESTEW